MELSSSATYLPNWDRFIQKYNPDIEFVEAFLVRISTLEGSTLQENILKKINVELWILLLSDNEINKDMYRSILESITIKNP